MTQNYIEENKNTNIFFSIKNACIECRQNGGEGVLIRREMMFLSIRGGIKRCFYGFSAASGMIYTPSLRL